MTPDARPILGSDPEFSSVIYACGHGRNGILLAPITAWCIASLIGTGKAEFDLTAYRIDRFGSAH
jgi:glycine/D-amino acid oxidase-like deaminating enzyme